MTFDAPSGAPQGGRADVGEPARRNRALLWTLVVLAVVVIALIIVSGFVTDLLWYQSVDATGVFTTQLYTKIGMLLFFGGLMAFVVGVNMWIAYRFRPVFRVMSPEQASLERYRVALDPIRRLAMIGLPLIIGLLAGVSATSEWKDWLLFRNGTSFGTSDPQFNVDVGFYVFTLPFLRFIIGFLFAAVVLAFIVAVVVHYVYGGIRLQPADDRFSRAAQAHLGTLVGLFVLLKAVAYYLDRFDVTLSTDDFVPGVTYKDANALLPGLTILMWISLICAVLFFLSAFRKGFTLAVTALVLLAGSALVVGSIYPAFVQSVQVRPSRAGPGVAVHPEQHQRDEGLLRARQRRGDAVHRGHGGDGCRDQGERRHDHQHPAARPADRQPDLQAAPADPRRTTTSRTPWTSTAIRSTARTAAPSSRCARSTWPASTDSQRNWTNDHLVYTHGFGMVAAYGNTAGRGGEPRVLREQPAAPGTLADRPAARLLRRVLAGLLDRRGPRGCHAARAGLPDRQRPGELHLHRHRRHPDRRRWSTS